MPTTEKGFAEVCDALKKILKPYHHDLVVKSESPDGCYLDAPTNGPNGQPMFFAAVRLGRKYVSFHLMPIYVNPALAAALSPELRRRMQGKSCFNFTRPDYALFRELEALTKAGFEDYRKSGWLGTTRLTEGDL